MREYAQQNNGLIPPNLLELRTYLKPPFDDASILQRYELTQTGNLAEASSRELVAEKTPADAKNDTMFKIGALGFIYQGIGSNQGQSGSGVFSAGKN